MNITTVLPIPTSQNHIKAAAKRWGITEKTAKTMKCENCAAFDVSYVRTTALEPVPLPHAPGVTVLHVVCEPQQRCPKLHVTYQGLTPIALPLEDMGPLLPWDEFASEMQITPIPRN